LDPELVLLDELELDEELELELELELEELELDNPSSSLGSSPAVLFLDFFLSFFLAFLLLEAASGDLVLSLPSADQRNPPWGI
jgi:hypothetical protein